MQYLATSSGAPPPSSDEASSSSNALPTGEHIVVDLKDVLRDFEVDYGKPLSAALDWDYLWPELSDRILSKEAYLEQHIGDEKVVDGVWDAIVQILVLKSVSDQEVELVSGTGFLIERPTPVSGSARPKLPPLILAPLPLVADTLPERVLVKLNYNFSTDPADIVTMRCYRIFYSNSTKLSNGQAVPDLSHIGFALLEPIVRAEHQKYVFGLTPLKIENNQYRESFVMSSAKTARVLTIGHRQGLPKTISTGKVISIEQRGGCWVVEYSAPSDLGAIGSVVVFAGKVSIAGRNSLLNLGTMDHFVGLVHYAMYENGADFGLAIIPTAEMQDSLFSQLAEALRFDVREHAVQMGISVDTVGLSADAKLTVPMEYRDALLARWEDSYIDRSRKDSNKSREVLIARGVRLAERAKQLYKAGMLIIAGLLVMGLSIGLLLFIFRIFFEKEPQTSTASSPVGPSALS